MPGFNREVFSWGLETLGLSISKQEAESFENRLSINPFDNEARAVLLGYYCSGRKQTKSDARKRNQHILWVFENAPDCGLLATPYLHISKIEHPSDYEQAKEILLRQCENFKNDPKVLLGLGSVLLYEESEVAIQVLRQAHAISDSENKAHVAFWLSTALHSFGKKNNDLDSLKQSVVFMQEVVAAKKPNREFDDRFWLARLALESEQFKLARDVSIEMLSDNPENNQSVHVAHIVLGSIAFSEADITSASEHLRLAGKVGSSPRLCSYGPMMTLAQNLLEAGERDAVIRYLRDCRKFWRMGKRELRQWIRQIEIGENPELQGDDPM